MKLKQLVSVLITIVGLYALFQGLRYVGVLPTTNREYFDDADKYTINQQRRRSSGTSGVAGKRVTWSSGAAPSAMARRAKQDKQIGYLRRQLRTASRPESKFQITGYS